MRMFPEASTANSLPVVDSFHRPTWGIQKCWIYNARHCPVVSSHVESYFIPAPGRGKTGNALIVPATSDKSWPARSSRRLAARQLSDYGILDRKALRTGNFKPNRLRIRARIDGPGRIPTGSASRSRRTSIPGTGLERHASKRGKSELPFRDLSPAFDLLAGQFCPGTSMRGFRPLKFRRRHAIGSTPGR